MIFSFRVLQKFLLISVLSLKSQQLPEDYSQPEAVIFLTEFE
jgi:hypothetical protein